MSNKVKDIDMKNRTYYLINDVINMKNFDSNNIKIDHYDKRYRKISFSSDDELPLNKTRETPSMKIVAKAGFLNENNIMLLF